MPIAANDYDLWGLVMAKLYSIPTDLPSIVEFDNLIGMGRGEKAGHLLDPTLHSLRVDVELLAIYNLHWRGKMLIISYHLLCILLPQFQQQHQSQQFWLVRNSPCLIRECYEAVIHKRQFMITYLLTLCQFIVMCCWLVSFIHYFLPSQKFTFVPFPWGLWCSFRTFNTANVKCS